MRSRSSAPASSNSWRNVQHGPVLEARSYATGGLANWLCSAIIVSACPLRKLRVAHRRVFHVNRAALKRKRRKANGTVVHVVQLEGPLERLSDCRTVPYLRFFLVRNEAFPG